MFGQTTTDQTQVDKIPPIEARTQPEETDYLFKIVFGIYMLVSVVVLINLLIAMMSDTYQRIQVFRTTTKTTNKPIKKTTPQTPTSNTHSHKYLNAPLQLITTK